MVVLKSSDIEINFTNRTLQTYKQTTWFELERMVDRLLFSNDKYRNYKNILRHSTDNIGTFITFRDLNWKLHPDSKQVTSKYICKFTDEFIEYRESNT